MSPNELKDYLTVISDFLGPVAPFLAILGVLLFLAIVRKIQE
jgi:hypothetical protein